MRKGDCASECTISLQDPSEHNEDSFEASSRTIDHPTGTGPSDGDNYNDVLSVVIRQRTKGMALYSVWGISVSMSLISILLVYQYSPPRTDDMQGDGFHLGGLCGSPQNASLWADLLRMQIDVIQNLVHASLLGGAAIVAAFRGDVVWLFFARNCAFYFGLPALSYLIVDLVSLARNGNASHDRLILASLFSLLCSVAFLTFRTVCQSVRRLQIEIWERTMQPAMSLAETVEGTHGILPKFLAKTKSQHSRATVIYRSAILVQCVSVLYTLSTTLLTLSPTLDCSGFGNRRTEGVMVMPSEDNDAGNDLAPFEMAYSLGAHESFLLSLFMLASVFPGCSASVGGAILGSAWRSVLACCSLIHVFSTEVTIDKRQGLSIFFTSLELFSMLPILISAICLAREDDSPPKTHIRGKLGLVRAPSYCPVVSDDPEEEDGEGKHVDIDGETNEVKSQQLRCPTLAQISASPRFSTRQRRGAYILWKSTLGLFVGMTTECCMLLKTGYLTSNENHDIYKWGMHVCAMYLFCCIMAESSPDVYARARVLLSLACPAGSMIGLWQLWVLCSNISGTESLDMWYFVSSTLFAWRGLTGLGQCVGLFLLRDIVPETDSCSDENDVVKPNGGRLLDQGGTILQDAVSRGRATLLKWYLPSIIIYAATVAIFGNCSEPMISPSTPSHCNGMEMFMLAQNWPGLGLFFHFGLLLVMFASDGLTVEVPSYEPSLAIASLFSFHLSLLVAINLFWNLLGFISSDDIVEPLTWSDWIRTLSLVWLMINAARLSARLLEVSNLKVVI